MEDLVGKAVVWIVLVNVVCFLAFWGDKTAARNGWERLSERSLLGMAILGAWPAAKLGQQMFRHKTQKQPFARRLNLIGFLQAVTLMQLLFLYFRD